MSINVATILILITIIQYIVVPTNCYWTGGDIVGSRYGAIGAGSGGVSRSGSVSSLYPTRMANLPSGMVLLGGEIVDTTNKVIQRVTGVGGTSYYSYVNQKSGPIFQTPTVDTGKHFVMFQDTNYPPGDGHYIVLRRWRGMPLGGVSLGGTLYEAFYLDLGDSVNALVSNWNLATYVPAGGRGYQGLVGSSISSMMNGGMGLRTGVRSGLNRLTRDVHSSNKEPLSVEETKNDNRFNINIIVTSDTNKISNSDSITNDSDVQLAKNSKVEEKSIVSDESEQGNIKKDGHRGEIL